MIEIVLMVLGWLAVCAWAAYFVLAALHNLENMEERIEFLEKHLGLWTLDPGKVTCVECLKRSATSNPPRGTRKSTQGRREKREHPIPR